MIDMLNQPYEEHIMKIRTGIRAGQGGFVGCPPYFCG
jgi:hypothetical protein